MKKKIRKKNILCVQKMLLDITWAYCNVLMCCGKCGRSEMGEGIVGDDAEVVVVVVVGD